MIDAVQEGKGQGERRKGEEEKARGSDQVLSLAERS